MSTFEIYLPTRILFGKGQIANAGTALRALGKRPLLVTGAQSMRTSGVISRLTRDLEAAGLSPIVFSGITPNPKIAEIDEAARIARESARDIVIGLGGGSAMDAAKATALAAGSNCSIREFLSGREADDGRPLAIATIPTVAGSGAEITRRAIVSDPARKLKSGIRSNSLFAKLSIVDPELTLSMPPKLTAESGFDVFCHAVETYISKKSQPVTRVFSEEAIRLVCNNLAGAVNDGSNLGYRTAMMQASLLMGFNLANAGTCMPHRLQYVFGGISDCSHSAGLTSIFMAWMKRAVIKLPAQFACIASFMEAAYADMTEEAAARKSIEALEALMTECHLTPLRLRDLSLTLNQCRDLARQATGDLQADPTYENLDTLVTICEDAW